MLAGHVLDRVRFVEDEQFVLRQVVHANHAQRQVREKQRMIDDQNIAALHAALRGLPEALVVEPAFFAEAVAVLGADLVPHVRLRQRGKISKGAIGRLIGPFFDGPQRFELPLVVEQVVLPLPRLLEAALAQVIAPPFNEHRRELVRVHRLDQRDVLVDQLLLKGDRVG
jgi:hypothetical protein